VTFEDVDARSATNRPPLSAARRNPWAVLLEISSVGAPDPNSEMHRIQDDVLRLGREPKKENWNALRELVDRWIERRGAEWWVAGFAKPLYACDPERTREWLIAQLSQIRGRDPSDHRYLCVLAAIGSVADPLLLPDLQRFAADATEPGKILYWYPRKFLDYAVHRCSQVHRWRLVQEDGGKYVILKPSDYFVQPGAEH
jgi:hypothetical protein